jgi:hypothetical protein
VWRPSSKRSGWACWREAGDHTVSATPKHKPDRSYIQLRLGRVGDRSARILGGPDRAARAEPSRIGTIAMSPTQS